MTLVVALIPDLLFGSRVQATLTQEGHEVRLLANQARLAGELAGAEVLVVDLGAENLQLRELLDELARSGGDPPPRTLGFYAHVDVDTRKRALEEGFDLVVPRSRMAREGAQLVLRLAAS
ncbi:MAG TPA: hypothetical protein VID48_11225 [Solirubrobacteraceae bacterium]|jgi:uncharacterized protein YbjT (DUF2867 family)